MANGHGRAGDRGTPDLGALGHGVTASTQAAGVAETVKKALRESGGTLSDDRRARAQGHITRLLDALAALAALHGADLGEVAATNIAKLASRAQRDQLKGDGDYR